MKKQSARVLTKRAVLTVLTVMLTAVLAGGTLTAAASDQALPERENLAYEADVEADNSFEGNQYFSTAYLTDGVHVPLEEDPHAGWSVDPFSVIARDEPVNVTVDLGKKYMLDTVVIRPCLYNNGEKMPSCYEVQLSEDYNNWTTVARVEGLALTAADDQIYTFEPVRGEYVRVAITEHSDKVDNTGSALSEFSEIEVYGEELPATPTPEPTATPSPAPTEAPTEEPTEEPTAVPAGTGEDDRSGKLPLAAIIAIIAISVCAVAAAVVVLVKAAKKKQK